MRTNVLGRYVICGVLLSGGLHGCTVGNAPDGNIAQTLTGSGPDPVLAWNATAAQTIVGPGGAGKVPPLALVDLAMVHTAIYDAVNAIEGTPFTVYKVSPNVVSPASSYAATAAAAHDVLKALYPAKAVALDAAYAASLANVADGDAKTNGISVGQQTAAGILAARASDGRNNVSGYTPGSGLGVWIPTPPGFLPAQAPYARFITPWTISPWTMESGSQFRAEPPPTLDSETFVHDYNETKALGAQVGSSRTPAQTDIGLFWADSPPLQWNRAWRGISIGKQLTLEDNARYFAMLTTASSDSLIACWDSKFYYGFWRPVTAIRAGGGNAALAADPTWLGAVVTPNHPEYPAAHGCFSGASAATLTTFFGDDHLAFTIDSKVAATTQKVRSYTSFSDALEEVGNARIYGGMHYRNSTEKGAIMGRQVSTYSSSHFFRVRHGRGTQHEHATGNDSDDGLGQFEETGDDL